MADTSGATEAWIRSEQRLAAAHAAMMRTPGLQFGFAGPDKPPAPPGWLRAALQALGKALIAAGPVLKYVFWIGLAVGAALVIWVLIRDVSLPRRRRGPAAPGADWRPDPGAAQALLEDADRLAAAERFDEAIHLLLFRSIEDIARRRPGLIGPALTSRDIGRLEVLPPPARAAFARIAEVVERSFFGGRPADRRLFDTARRDYETFAFPEAWA